MRSDCSRPRARRDAIVGAAVATAAVALILAACGKVQPDPTAALAKNPPSIPPAPSFTTSTTATAAVDPGSLPQTLVRPSTTDPGFAARVQTLWAAVMDGQPSEALPFFFPLSAYLQVKAVADPASDWAQRLVADYDQDITTLHHQLTVAAGVSGPAVFLGIDVPAAAAVLVKPGAEFNRLSYWRVYNSHIAYRVGASVRSFVVASMISWRGEWYVVHLSSIR